jgi:tetratricopeptide (TPR) repeat protein
MPLSVEGGRAREQASRSVFGRLAVAGCAAALLATPAAAQRKPVEEFTRQGLLVPNFTPGPGADLKLGRKVGDVVRSRVEDLANKKQVDVINARLMRTKSADAGFNPDSSFSLDESYVMGRVLRVDEYIGGTVTVLPKAVRLDAEIIVMRDRHLRQPLPMASAAKLEQAGDALAKNITAARTQLIPMRRCENALRGADGAGAIAAARQGIAAYPKATILRICLVWALIASHQPSDAVLGVSREVLAIDSTNYYALEAAAVALDSLRQREAAAAMWLRLAATDPLDLKLSERVITAMIDGGNGRRAEPLVLQLAKDYPAELPLLGQKWHITFETKNWARAVEAGEALIERDSLARADSVFWLRLATVYKALNMPIKAVETLAHAVAKFPNDPRLYALYTQYIKTEADTVIPRGLALYPKSAELLALNAKELRVRGKLEESLAASRRALEFDSTMSQGDLIVAQLEFDLGRPDSALSTLRRALGRGEDTSVVAQFALAKGNALYRAANGTHSSTDFGLALHFLALADTLRSSVQSKFLVGAAALGLSQAALTEAPKLADKVESCRLARLGADMIPVARSGLQAGADMYGDAAKQSLDYLAQLDPFVTQQLAAFCGAGPGRH